MGKGHVGTSDDRQSGCGNVRTVAEAYGKLLAMQYDDAHAHQGLQDRNVAWDVSTDFSGAKGSSGEVNEHDSVYDGGDA